VTYLARVFFAASLLIAVVIISASLATTIIQGNAERLQITIIFTPDPLYDRKQWSRIM
jgi:hypothetical protein